MALKVGFSQKRAHADHYFLWDDNEGERWIVEGGKKQTEVVLPPGDVPPGALHRYFADLVRGDFDSHALGWARALGLLGHGSPVVTDRGEFLGELLSDWHTEVFNMWAARRAWLLTSCTESLSEMHGHFALMPRVSRSPLRSGGEIVFGEITMDVEAEELNLPRTKRGTAKVLREMTISLTNSGLQGAGNARVASLVVSDREAHAEVQSVALNMIGFLWFEFALSLSGRVEERPCENCDEPIIIDPNRGTRRHRRFCSTRCRVAAHEKKRRDAVHALQSGEAISKVATDFGTTTKKVRDWARVGRTNPSKAGRR